MSDTGKKILAAIGAAVPQLSEVEKEKLLSFSEDVAFFAERKAEAERTPAPAQERS